MSKASPCKHHSQKFSHQKFVLHTAAYQHDLSMPAPLQVVYHWNKWTIPGFRLTSLRTNEPSKWMIEDRTCIPSQSKRQTDGYGGLATNASSRMIMHTLDIIQGHSASNDEQPHPSGKPNFSNYRPYFYW